jgi:hypothetical protein
MNQLFLSQDFVFASLRNYPTHALVNLAGASILTDVSLTVPGA